MGSKLIMNLAIVAPKAMTKETPYIVSVTQCSFKKRRGWSKDKENPYPGTVKLSIVERDTWQNGDDIVITKNKSKHVAVDDLVVEFEGQLEANESKFGANFVLDEEQAAKALAANAGVGSDRIWLNFEGRVGDAFQLCLPRDKFEGDESFFVEVSAAFTEIPSKLPKTKKAAVVAIKHPRTPHTVLAVEPLTQASMQKNSKAMGTIMDAFHPKGPKSLRDRKWSRYMLKRVNAMFFRSVIVDSGCSLIILTMMLRYLRVPDGEGGLISIYDKFVQPMVDAKTLEAKYAPRKFVINPKERKKKLKGVYPDPSEIKNAKAKKAAKEKRDALIAALGKEPGGDFFGIEFKESKHAEDSEVGRKFIEAATLDKTNYWPILLLWYMRQQEKIAEGYDIKRMEATKLVVKDGAVTRVRFEEGDLVQAQTGKAVTHGPRYLLADKGHAMPPSPALLKKFGLEYESVAVADLAEGWEKRVTDSLDDGIPVMVLFSRGIYTKAIGKKDNVDVSGHWCIIVGYRDLKADDGTTKRSFIINDPARGGAPQYDTLREEQLAALLEERDIKSSKHGKNRERQGWNLIAERRRLMTVRKLHFLKPKGWDPLKHKGTLHYDGRSKWTAKDGA